MISIAVLYSTFATTKKEITKKSGAETEVKVLDKKCIIIFLPFFSRFDNHGGGWGYSGHSIEAIRFMVDTGNSLSDQQKFFQLTQNVTADCYMNSVRAILHQIVLNLNYKPRIRPNTLFKNK